MQTVEAFYWIQCILNLYFLMDLAGWVRLFLSSKCLEEVMAGVAPFTDF